MEKIVQWLKEQPGQILAVVFLLVGLYFFVSLIRRGLSVAAGKQVRVRAQVIQVQRTPQPDMWLAVFETGGLIQRFTLPEAVAERLQPGQKGRLVYRGNTFIKFKDIE